MSSHVSLFFSDTLVGVARRQSRNCSQHWNHRPNPKPKTTFSKKNDTPRPPTPCFTDTPHLHYQKTLTE